MTTTPSITRSIRNQKRALLTAACLVVASIWISVPLGEWRGGMFLAVGIVTAFISAWLQIRSFLRT